MIKDDDCPSEKLDTAVLVNTLREDLNELSWTPAALMDRMKSLGDYRPSATILRGINRALEGEIRPSGELLALVRQAVRFRQLLIRTYKGTAWKELDDGSHTAEVEDFRITLVPRSKGRWLILVMHKNGYCAPYPRWQDTLEVAKNMAFITLDNAQSRLHECAKEQSLESAAKDTEESL